MPKTLTMIDPRPNGSGGQYERGQTYTLADDLADYFLSIGVARYPTLQQTQVLADRDPATGEVSTIGTGRDPLGAPVVAVTSPGGGVTLSSEALAAIENSYPVKNAATQTTPQAWMPLILETGITSLRAEMRINAANYEFSGEVRGTLETNTVIAKLFSALLPVFDTEAICVAKPVGVARVGVTRQHEVIVLDAPVGTKVICLDGLFGRINTEEYRQSTPVAPLLPIVRIVTDGGAELPAPALGVYIPATISVEPNGHNVPALSPTAFTVSGHGHSTWAQPKKPMKLKFSSAVSLLGLPAEKSFRAIANHLDKTSIRNAVAFEMARRLSAQWTPKEVYCEVYLNGLYQGLYQMLEPVKSGPSRLPIVTAKGSSVADPATENFMFEVNERMESEGAAGFRSTIQNVPVQFEEPEDPSAGQISYIKARFTAFEAALYGANWLDPELGYAKYIDMESWANWYLVSELTRNADAVMFSSCKLFKVADSGSGLGKIFFGPLWDSDRSLGAGSVALLGFVDFSAPSSGWYIRNAKWWIRLMEDPAFFAVVNARWAVLKAEVEKPGGVIDWGKSLALRVSGAVLNDARRWGYTPDARSRFDIAITWLVRRINWLNSRFTTPTVKNLVILPKSDGAVTLTGTGKWYNTGGGTASFTSAAGNPLGGHAVRLTWSAAPTLPIAGPYMYTIPAEAGKTYTALVLVRCSKPQRVMFDVEHKTAAGATVAKTSARNVDVPANRMVTLPVVIFTQPAETTRVQLSLFNAAGFPWEIGDWYEICGVMVVEGAFPDLRFADPVTSTSWVWDGAAFGSTSTGPTP